MRYGAAATSYAMLEPIRATVIQMMPQGLNLVLLAAVLLQHARHIPEPFAVTPDWDLPDPSVPVLITARPQARKEARVQVARLLARKRPPAPRLPSEPFRDPRV